METSLRLVKGTRECIQPFIVVLGGKHRQVSVEDLYNEFGYVCCLSFFLLGLFYQMGKNSIERFDELSGIEDYFFGSSFGKRLVIF